MEKITTKYAGDMLFETKVGNHTIQIDVPESMGGSDRAPTPPQFLVASLGGCIAAYLANYCNQIGLDPTGLTVEVEFEKVPDPTRLTDIKVHAHLPNADISRREKALLRVAEHCPVDITMTNFDGPELKITGK